MSNFDQIKFDYAMYYPVIALRARGALGKMFVFKEYWYGRRVDRYAYPYNPRSQIQQTWRGYLSEAVSNWHGFDDNTKLFYGILAQPERLIGYMKYCKMYMQAKSIVYNKP